MYANPDQQWFAEELGLNVGPDILSTYDQPAPQGARAAGGTALGLLMGTIGAAAWSRLEYGVWNPNRLAGRSERWTIAGVLTTTAMLGAGLAARRGTRRRAVAGAFIGSAIAQVPAILDPSLFAHRPIVGNLWQYGVPLASVLIAINF